MKKKTKLKYEWQNPIVCYLLILLAIMMLPIFILLGITLGIISLTITILNIMRKYQNPLKREEEMSRFYLEKFYISTNYEIKELKLKEKNAK